MKKVITSFILVFMLVLLGLNNIKAEENNVEIKSIQIQEKSDNVSSNIEEDNLNYNMDLKLYDIDDYVTYKIIVKNNSDKDYEIETIKDNLNSDYIESSYTTNTNELKKGEEIEVYLTLKYKNSITTSKETFSHNLVITFNYTNGESSTISDIILDDNTVSAGNTGINKSAIIKIICYTIIVVSIILLIILAITRKKNLKKMGLLLLLTLIIPTVYAEDNEGKCSININIILHNTNTATFKTGKEVNLTMHKLAGAPDDIQIGYLEGNSSGDEINYDEYYLYSESDWYVANENIISIEKATKEQYNNVKDNLTSDNIVSVETSKYPIYMWYEVTDVDNQLGSIYWYSDASVVFLNEDASFMFLSLYAVEKIDLSYFDINKVTNMSYIFSCSGRIATTFDIGYISNWDVSNVTNMSGMFAGAGATATTEFLLDLSGWNTSSVTDMSDMFASTGENATKWSIGDLSGWDTSKVADMRYMFLGAGNNVTKWDIGDLSSWDTSNVTDMSCMFQYAGSNAAEFSLDLSGWNTSSVTDMYLMFDGAGLNATIFSLDLSGWNTSSVTDMGRMFCNAGRYAQTFSLDLSGWDTSNVTDMSYMFQYAGSNAAEWYIGSLNIYASDLYRMFYYCPNVNAILNIHNVPTSYYQMFNGAATNPDASIVVNYSPEVSGVIDNIINTKSSTSNVVKGSLIE